MAKKETDAAEEVVVEEVAAVVEEPESVAELVVEDAVEPTVEPVVEAAVVEPVAVVEDTKYAAPVAVTREDIENYLPTPAGPAVVGTGVVDDVVLSSCIYKNDANRRSLTVYHVQRRLIELELLQDGLVKAGYYGDLTKQAVAVFQANNNIVGDGLMNADTFTALFEGDPNVRVSLG
jgi:peptidoglycan hydrolase-like protein with peptidoglycan-binding domain